MEDPFYVKYLKYKMKYLALKKELKGGFIRPIRKIRRDPNIENDWEINIVEDVKLNKRVKYNKKEENKVSYELDTSPFTFPANNNIPNILYNFLGKEIYNDTIKPFLEENEKKFLISDYYNFKNNYFEYIKGEIKDGQFGAITGTGEADDDKNEDKERIGKIIEKEINCTDKDGVNIVKIIKTYQLNESISKEKLKDFDLNLLKREIKEETGYNDSTVKIDTTNLIHSEKKLSINIYKNENILAFCYNKNKVRKCISFIALTEDEIEEKYSPNGNMSIIDDIGGLAFIPVVNARKYYDSIFEPIKRERTQQSSSSQILEQQREVKRVRPTESDEGRGYRHGYDDGRNRMKYQPEKKDSTDYMRGYNKGHNEGRGFRHGYSGIDPVLDNSDYMRGYNEGEKKRYNEGRYRR